MISSESIVWTTRRVEPEGEIKLFGWRRWKDVYGKWGKYHALLINHPRNHYNRKSEMISSNIWLSDACGRGWGAYVEPIEHNPPKSKCCKNCIRELEKLGIL